MCSASPGVAFPCCATWEDFFTRILPGTVQVACLLSSAPCPHATAHFNTFVIHQFFCLLSVCHRSGAHDMQHAAGTAKVFFALQNAPISELCVFPEACII